jgi:hypothetical protein
MILDYKIFGQIKGTEQKPEQLLYIVEQTPGMIVSHDISKYLYEKNYFGSYNRAFFKESNENLNTKLLQNLYGERIAKASRARIFQHLQKDVVDLKSLKDLLRYNGYLLKKPWDPSSIHPGEGISARYDLSHGGLQNLSGGIDCKVTNHELVQELAAVAISGPTNENNENLKTFNWKDAKNSSIAKKGVPDEWDFPYLLMKPQTICCDNKNDEYEQFNKKPSK